MILQHIHIRLTQHLILILMLTMMTEHRGVNRKLACYGGI